MEPTDFSVSPRLVGFCSFQAGYAPACKVNGQIVKRGFAPSLFLTIQKIRLAAICGEADYSCGL